MSTQPILPKQPKVVIGVSNAGSVDQLFTQQLIKIVQLYSGSVIDIFFDPLKPIDFSRNAIFAKFLMDYPYATHLLVLDSDVLLPIDGIQKLLEGDKPLISGIIVQKAPPFYPLLNVRVGPNVYRFALNWNMKERYVTIDSVGFGCLMVRRDVLQVMAPPWAKTTSQSEDYYFCEKAQMYGFPLLADNTVQCGHLGHYTYTLNDFISNFQQKEMTKSASMGVKLS